MTTSCCHSAPNLQQQHAQPVSKSNQSISQSWLASSFQMLHWCTVQEWMMMDTVYGPAALVVIIANLYAVIKMAHNHYYVPLHRQHYISQQASWHIRDSAIFAYNSDTRRSMEQELNDNDRHGNHRLVQSQICSVSSRNMIYRGRMQAWAISCTYAGAPKSFMHNLVLDALNLLKWQIP